MKTIQDINNFISLELQNKYNIVKHNLAMFMAQCDHESQGFTKLVENLNYNDPDRLIAIFPKYFKDNNPNEYINNPQKLANLVYANRMKNGDVNSGDGWKFRGRGYLQISGRKNYTAFNKWQKTSINVLDLPDMVSHKEYALLSSIWYWDVNKINKIVPDITKVTKLINGGINGLIERTILYKRYVRILNV